MGLREFEWMKNICKVLHGIHYKETVVESTETCPNQDVINDMKLIENCPQ